MMFKYILQGFLLGLSFVAPIGMQNLYVINSALREPKLKAYRVALIVILFDVSLSLTCFYGMGLILDSMPMVKKIIILIGGLVVIYMGYKIMRSTPVLSNEVEVELPLTKTILACFLVTWANPQAIIDGSLLIGGFRASLPIDGARYFISGVCLASISWFLFLTSIVLVSKNNFNQKFIKILNLVCGGIIIIYGLKLLVSLF